MYLDHFRLKQYPFQLVPDPEFLYLGTDHSKAKAYLDYVVYNRDGFVVLTGEIGAGKTTLLHKFLGEMDKNVLAAKIFQTQLTATEFLQAVLVEFGLKPFHAKKVELMDMLNSFLVDRFLEGRQLVLVIDEAQDLSDEALEEVRLLSGLESQKEKIVHVILLGQPELRDRLNRPEMEQLNQRIRLRYHLSALSEQETTNYIRHRIQLAGATDREIFENNAFPVIYSYSGGIPRLINVLCDTALLCAFADGFPTVGETVAETAAQEMQWVPFAERQKRSPGVITKRSAGVNQTEEPNAWTARQSRAIFDRVDEMATRLSEIEGSVKEVAGLLRDHYGVPVKGAIRKR
jgi:type II secretory pathway predicted ATPase ExeA